MSKHIEFCCMIRNFLFDLGGVLIDLDVQRSITAICNLLETQGNGQTPVSALDLLGGGETEFMQKYQTGDISTEEFVNTILSLCKPGTTKQQVVDAWFAMLLSFPKHRIDKIRALRDAGYHVYLLSNINELHVEWTVAHFKEWGATDLFDAIFFSNEIHLAKPDIRCYEKVLNDTGINPQETLYIDDLAKNIEAGQKAGFQCFQALGDEWLPIADKMINLRIQE